MPSSIACRHQKDTETKWKRIIRYKNREKADCFSKLTNDVIYADLLK
jgi:hypothetical protein